MILSNTVLSLMLFLLFADQHANVQTTNKLYEPGSVPLELEAVIGGDIDDDDYFLYRPVDLALDSRGNLFVLDYSGFCVKKFDSNGIHIKTFSGKGEGPGEMMQGIYMSLDPDENVVIFDDNLYRFTIYNNDGEYIDSFSFLEFGFRYIENFDIHPNGNYILESRYVDINNLDAPTLYKISQYSLVTKIETPIDSALIKESEYRVQPRQRYILPFHPRLLWGINSAGDIIVANSKNYNIKIYSSDLTLLKNINVEHELRKVTDKDKNKYYSDCKEAELRWVKNNIKFPRYKSCFDRLLLDSAGNIVLRLDEWPKDNEVQDFHVLSPDGQFINQVVLPRLVKQAIIMENIIYTIEIHEEEDYAIYKYQVD